MRLLFRCPQKKRTKWEQMQCRLLWFTQARYINLKVIKKDGFIYYWEMSSSYQRNKTLEFWL